MKILQQSLQSQSHSRPVKPIPSTSKKDHAFLEPPPVLLSHFPGQYHGHISNHSQSASKEIIDHHPNIARNGSMSIKSNNNAKVSEYSLPHAVRAALCADDHIFNVPENSIWKIRPYIGKIKNFSMRKSGSLAVLSEDNHILELSKKNTQTRNQKISNNSQNSKDSKTSQHSKISHSAFNKYKKPMNYPVKIHEDSHTKNKLGNVYDINQSWRQNLHHKDKIRGTKTLNQFERNHLAESIKLLRKAREPDPIVGSRHSNSSINKSKQKNQVVQLPNKPSIGQSNVSLVSKILQRHDFHFQKGSQLGSNRPIVNTEFPQSNLKFHPPSIISRKDGSPAMITKLDKVKQQILKQISESKLNKKHPIKRKTTKSFRRVASDNQILDRHGHQICSETINSINNSMNIKYYNFDKEQPDSNNLSYYHQVNIKNKNHSLLPRNFNKKVDQKTIKCDINIDYVKPEIQQQSALSNYNNQARQKTTLSQYQKKVKLPSTKFIEPKNILYMDPVYNKKFNISTHSDHVKIKKCECSQSFCELSILGRSQIHLYDSSSIQELQDHVNQILRNMKIKEELEYEISIGGRLQNHPNFIPKSVVDRFEFTLQQSEINQLCKNIVAISKKDTPTVQMEMQNLINEFWFCKLSNKPQVSQWTLTRLRKVLDRIMNCPGETIETLEKVVFRNPDLIQIYQAFIEFQEIIKSNLPQFQQMQQIQLNIQLEVPWIAKQEIKIQKKEQQQNENQIIIQKSETNHQNQIRQGSRTITESILNHQQISALKSLSNYNFEKSPMVQSERRSIIESIRKSLSERKSIKSITSKASKKSRHIFKCRSLRGKLMKTLSIKSQDSKLQNLNKNNAFVSVEKQKILKRKRKVLSFILRKQQQKSLAKQNPKKFEKLQKHAIERLRTKDGKFLKKDDYENTNQLDLMTANDNNIKTPKIKRIQKHKKTNGIAPLFKVRKNYRAFLKDKRENIVINAFIIF